MFDEPELYIVRFPEDEERRAARDEQEREGRRRYLERLVDALPLIDAVDDDVARAAAILDHLFVHVRPASDDAGERCRCSCHPRLPESDFHDYGFSCACTKTPEERRAFWDAWQADRDAYWASPEGQARTRARQAEEDELIAWLAVHPDVVVTQYGGVFPEQWRGTVAGHSFYFLEKRDEWSIELDLRPSGHFSEVWVGGDLDDESRVERREIEEGDVIAEGTTSAQGYGRTPVERAAFIIDTIRVHLGQQSCAAHTVERAGLEQQLGRRFEWCPACGTRLDGP